MFPYDWFQELLILETKLTYLVQPRFSYYEKFLYLVSAASDPNNAVLYIYPCITAFCGPFSNLPIDLMLVGSVINWTSTELKWILMGDRPYWWVKEVAQAYPELPPLHQSHNTCVANPGNPSAHVMLSAGILFIILKALLSLSNNLCRHFSKSTSDSLITSWYSYRGKIGLWMLYIIIIVIIMLSRIYNATHFPHQCILGAILGGIMANTVSANWNSDWQKRQTSFSLLFYAVIPLAVAFGSYWIQKAIGIDPQRSVRLAFKWCFSPTDINVNTTPVYSLTCSCGSMLGLAIALIFQRTSVNLITCQTYKQKNPGTKVTLHSFSKENSWLFHLTNGVGVLISAYLLIQLKKKIPTDNVIVFYLHHFAINMAAPILFLGFVPIFLVILCKKVRVKQD